MRMRKFVTVLLLAAMLMASKPAPEFGENLNNPSAKTEKTRKEYTVRERSEEELLANAQGTLKREDVLPGVTFKEDLEEKLLSKQVDDCFAEAVRIAEEQAASVDEDDIVTKSFMDGFVDWLGNVEDAKEKTDEVLEDIADDIREAKEKE